MKRLESRRAAAVAGALVLLLLAWVAWFAWDATRPLEWSGTIEARDISVGSRVGGRVREVLVREGAMVVSGEAIVVLEPGDLEGLRMQAEGELARTRAVLAALERGSRPEEVEAARARAAAARAGAMKTQAGRPEAIARARAALASAQARYSKAKVDAERARRLLEADAATRAEHDAAVSALEAATGERDAAQAALVEAERGSREEDVAAARAEARAAAAQARQVSEGPRVEEILAQRGVVTAAEGRLAAIEENLRELVVRAPAKARIESLDLRPGDLLAPNATAATLLEPDELFVRVYVPETQLAHAHPGDRVTVHVDTFPDRAFDATIAFVSGRGEYTPRNLQTVDDRANQVFATRVRLDDGLEVLRAGMAALVRVKR